MIFLKIIGCIILGLYGLYLAIGVAIFLPEITLAISLLFTAPLKGTREIPPEHIIYTAPLPKQIKEIPDLLKDWGKSTIFWIIFPFLVIMALLSKKKEE